MTGTPPVAPRWLTNARVVTATRVLRHGWLRLDQGRIVEVGEGDPVDGGVGEPGQTLVHDAGGAWVVPGFVDVHVHGGAGVTMSTADADGVRQAAAGHLAHGTTTMLSSVASLPWERMTAAAAVIAGVIDGAAGSPAPGGNLVGIHFEGPFLSPARRGAQAVDALLEPSAPRLDELRDAAGGHARSMTITPELPGALRVIEHAARSRLVAHSATRTPPSPSSTPGSVPAPAR